MNPLRWRKMTWVLNLWNALFLVWLIVGVGDRPSEDCPPADSACIAASDVGTGIGVALILMLWFLGFLVLSLVWLMSRPKHRQCPRCGHDVKKGRTVCGSCGYDFAASPEEQPAMVPAAAGAGPAPSGDWWQDAGGKWQRGPRPG
jgi:hypothetical protein